MKLFLVTTKSAYDRIKEFVVMAESKSEATEVLKLENAFNQCYDSIVMISEISGKSIKVSYL